jgi:hypothetical protein
VAVARSMDRFSRVHTGTFAKWSACIHYMGVGLHACTPQAAPVHDGTAGILPAVDHVTRSCLDVPAPHKGSAGTWQALTLPALWCLYCSCCCCCCCCDRFFYASSACIYPEHKQLETEVEGGGLKEGDAWPAQVRTNCRQRC